MRSLLFDLLLISIAIWGACASAPESAFDGPGPMRPLAPDLELDAAPPLALDDEPAMHAWLAERVAAANGNVPERVRLPIMRRAAAFDCDCPEFAVAATSNSGPFHWLALVDLTSAGIPPGEWIGWVDGRFTGETRTYRGPGGSDVTAPAFEVLRQSLRHLDDVAAARFVRVGASPPR